MIEIKIIKNHNNSYKEIHCKGHAGYAVSGDDIICSAVSVLVINTVNSLDKLLQIKVVVYKDESDGIIDCVFQESLDEKGNLLIDSLILGLENIRDSYGKKYLNVKIKEV